jgi:lipid-A-disaccharide synthase
MLETTKYIRKANPESEFILPLAKTIHRKDFPFLSDNKIEHLRIVEGETAIAIKACDLIIAASGTVTLESAILGTPLVIIYKLSPFTYFLARHLIKVPYIGLVNLVAKECLAPELIQDEVTPLRIAEETLRILGDRNLKEYLKKRFADVKRLLGNPGAADRAAKIALQQMRVTS